MIYLISAFPNGFTPEFKEHLTSQEIPNHIVFIASDFRSSQTQVFATSILQDFSDCNIEFDDVTIIDYSISKEKAACILHQPSLIWLMGGDTLLQMSYLREYDIANCLRNHAGVIIGMSAGAINLAKHVVLAKDQHDHIPELSLYEGLGLVHINIEPHLEDSNKQHEQEIKEAAMFSDIYGLYDESFIAYHNHNFEIFGPYRIFTRK